MRQKSTGHSYTLEEGGTRYSVTVNHSSLSLCGRSWCFTDTPHKEILEQKQRLVALHQALPKNKTQKAPDQTASFVHQLDSQWQAEGRVWDVTIRLTNVRSTLVRSTANIPVIQTSNYFIQAVALMCLLHLISNTQPSCDVRHSHFKAATQSSEEKRKLSMLLTKQWSLNDTGSTEISSWWNIQNDVQERKGL